MSIGLRQLTRRFSIVVRNGKRLEDELPLEANGDYTKSRRRSLINGHGLKLYRLFCLKTTASQAWRNSMANQVKQGGAEWKLMVNSKVELNEILYFFSFPSKFLYENINVIVMRIGPPLSTLSVFSL
ncbi:hypothetical protein ACE6H2_004865 [Prunus campanulata]